MLDSTRNQVFNAHVSGNIFIRLFCTKASSIDAHEARHRTGCVFDWSSVCRCANPDTYLASSHYYGRRPLFRTRLRDTPTYFGSDNCCCLRSAGAAAAVHIMDRRHGPSGIDRKRASARHQISTTCCGSCSCSLWIKKNEKRRLKLLTSISCSLGLWTVLNGCRAYGCQQDVFRWRWGYARHTDESWGVSEGHLNDYNVTSEYHNRSSWKLWHHFRLRYNGARIYPSVKSLLLVFEVWECQRFTQFLHNKQNIHFFVTDSQEFNVAPTISTQALIF